MFFKTISLCKYSIYKLVITKYKAHDLYTLLSYTQLKSITLFISLFSCCFITTAKPIYGELCAWNTLYYNNKAADVKRI